MIHIPRKKIREYDAKKMLAANLNKYGYDISLEAVIVNEHTDLEALEREHAWLNTKKLAVKPDQLIGKKGKHNLILLNANLADAKKFIKEQMGKTVEIGSVSGVLTHFIIEPFVEHDNEYFLAIMSQRDEDVILFSEKGGVDIEEHWHKVIQIAVPIDGNIEEVIIKSRLTGVSGDRRERLVSFINALYRYYVDFGCTYLEMNPLAFDKQDRIMPLGFVCELDDCERFKCESKWNGLEFPQPFGRKLYNEEKFVAELDDKTGASLKLTVLNPDGKIWLLVAGGGASVIYADTVVDLGHGKELGNYGEYSGDPNEEETYYYAKTVVDLATNHGQLNGNRVLLIGGGVANFTNVANTFKGIIRALRESKERLQKMQIFVRRGGPNYEEGLKMMRALGEEIKVPIDVYGPETHMTKIVDLAIKQMNGSSI